MSTLTHHKLLSFIRKIHWKELLAILFILLGIYFFRQERHELRSLIPFIEKADKKWVWTGISVTGLYIILQSGLLAYSFRAIQARLNSFSSVLLFLKQNFLSIFLPGGGIATYAYMPDMLRGKNIEKHKIFQAGGIHGFISILSVVIVAWPVLLYASLNHHLVKGATAALTGAILLIIVLLWLVAAFKRKSALHQLFVKYFPATEKYIEELFAFNLSGKEFFIAVLFSIGIELTGIFHLFIAMKACGAAFSWEAAFTGYIISTLFLLISPFLKGLGAVELSLVYILKLYGYNTLTALEITLLYRMFEFWLPFSAGLVAWAWKARNIFFRLLPPALIFILGAINIFSVLTPPIASRLHLLREYLPVSGIHASNALVILFGLVLIMTAAFLIRGLKAAWGMALLLSILSLVGHLTKALDYEESLFALAVVSILLFTRRQYRLKSSPAFSNIGFITAIAAFITVLIFGTISYHFLDERHFGISFTWLESFRYALSGLLLNQDISLHSITHFGEEFMFSIKLLAFAVWIFLFYTLIRPYISRSNNDGESLEKAKLLLKLYGTSPLDHFKVDDDKLLFVSKEQTGFISYKIANGFAIVLEEPVCEEKNKIPLLKGFEKLCRKAGLKPAFYRVDEESLYYFSELKKKKMIIGQEGILSTKDFTLEGRENKALRNSLNSLSKKGYAIRLHNAPLSSEFVKELKHVSDEWLAHNGKNEMSFSQGRFDPGDICQQDIIALHDSNNNTVAFLNILPDYSPDECTYDLIRKIAAAPGGAMDALVIRLVEYARDKGFSHINLGLVPMSGIIKPNNAAERIVKYAYEKIRRFRYYQGLREFKEKYAAHWSNKYLIYENDFDLVQLPSALHKVMRVAKN